MRDDPKVRLLGILGAIGASLLETAFAAHLFVDMGDKPERLAHCVEIAAHALVVLSAWKFRFHPAPNIGAHVVAFLLRHIIKPRGDLGGKPMLWNGDDNYALVTALAQLTQEP